MVLVVVVVMAVVVVVVCLVVRRWCTYVSAVPRPRPRKLIRGACGCSCGCDGGCRGVCVVVRRCCTCVSAVPGRGRSFIAYVFRLVASVDSLHSGRRGKRRATGNRSTHAVTRKTFNDKNAKRSTIPFHGNLHLTSLHCGYATTLSVRVAFLEIISRENLTSAVLRQRLAISKLGVGCSHYPKYLHENCRKLYVQRTAKEVVDPS